MRSFSTLGASCAVPTSFRVASRASRVVFSRNDKEPTTYAGVEQGVDPESVNLAPDIEDTSRIGLALGGFVEQFVKGGGALAVSVGLVEAMTALQFIVHLLLH